MFTFGCAALGHIGRASRFRALFTGALAAVLFAACATAANDRIFTPVKVNGIPMRFGLDTGAGVEISMWRDVSDMLALKVSQPNPSEPLGPGEIRAGVSEPLSLDFMGTVHPGSRIAIVDAPSFLKWQIQGLVGWPSVRNNIWLIDLSRGQIQPIPELPDVSGWLKYPLVQGATTVQFVVPGTAGTKPGIISIDTGSPDGVALAPALWDSWRAAHPQDPVTYGGAFMLATGYSRLEVAAAKEWSIDRLLLKDVLLSQAHPTDLASFGPDYLATFGLRALRNFSLIIDGKAGFAYFRPTNNPAPLGDYNRLGAIFCPTDRSATRWTAAVLPDTPAAKAGLRDGDVLVGLNHLEIAHWRQRPETWPPRIALQPAGTPVEIEYTRAGRHLVAQAVLQDILRPGAAPVPAQPFPPEVPDFHFLPPLTSVIRRAEALKLPLRDPALSTVGTLQKDDKVTALVTVVDDRRLRQWLVLFVNTELKPSEQKPGKPYHVFTSSGNDLVFEWVPTGMAVRSVGPFEQGETRSEAIDKWSGAILNRGALTVGFDRVAATLLKVAAVPEARFGFNSAPFPENEASKDRKLLEAAGVMAVDERAFVGGANGLVEFFRIAAQTPGVRDVLRELLDLSWKDYLRNPNINIDFRLPVEDIASDWWGLPPGMPCRTLTFQVKVNGVPRIVCRVAATRPVRPLETVAGIVGIAAGRVDGSGPHVMVRLLGASPAGTAP